MKKIITSGLIFMILSLSTFIPIRSAIIPLMVSTIPIYAETSYKVDESKKPDTEENNRLNKSKFIAMTLCIMGLEHIYLENWVTLFFHWAAYAAGGVGGFALSLIDFIIFFNMDENEWNAYLESNKGFPWL